MEGIECSSVAGSWQWLCRVVAEQAGVALERVDSHARLSADLGIDSLEMQSLLMVIESELDLIPERTELHRVDTVGQLHTLISLMIGAKRVQPETGSTPQPDVG